MASETAAPVRRHRRWFWWLTALAAFAVWHAIFDITLDRGMKAYVEARAQYVRGQGPEVTIRGAMGEARRDGAQKGLLGASLVLGAAIVVAAAGRRRSRSR